MQIFKSFLIVVLGICINSEIIAKIPEAGTSESFSMQKSIPVWVHGREKEMNLTLGFRGVFQVEKNQKITLRITASTLYRVFLNGKFLGYGPARAGHGYFRIDEYDLDKKVQKGENIVAVEVAGYNVNSFYTLDQPSFLQAEVQSGEKIILATGSNPGFEAFQLKERLQKVERYSFQRPFTEYYRLKKDFDEWKISAGTPIESLKLTNLSPVKLLPRNLLLPDFNLVHPLLVYSRGTIQFKKPDKYKKDRSLTQITEKFKGYNENELEVLPSQIIQEIINKTQDTVSSPFTASLGSLTKNEFRTFDFGTNLSGFIGGKVSCAEPSTVIFYFDELLTDGDVNTKKRMPDVNNQVIYELGPGDYALETFESYTFKYLKIIVPKGSVRIHDVYLREYAYPENPNASFICSNNKLNEIYKAAKQTFRQNAVDVLTDCPSRERAGWLCDSYFSAIMEKDFTGYSAVTHNFYENYALPESFDFLPEGMIPMCYPADHPDGGFIPNWALWFIIQIDDYAQREGDPVLVARLKPRIEKLLEYFARFENKDGLLEKLESWIFVEWSKANDFVLDVNYPTNMLYSAALAKAGNLYHNDNWQQKAAHIRQTVLEQSYNGTFFVDNAIRNNDGKLQATQNTSEVCQYYAFFFDIATPETHPALWKKLITDFGPNRNDAITYPNLFLANAFIGNYLRMDILSRYGLNSQLFKEVQDYFYPMAKRTGTLWEHMGLQGSCNHGFASYIGHILYRDILGISRVDYLKKEVTVQFTNIELNECRGVIPVGEGLVELKWKRSGNYIRYAVNAPSGYKVKVENLSSLKLMKDE
jgi:alpha-L-rhamnosidase